MYIFFDNVSIFPSLGSVPFFGEKIEKDNGFCKASVNWTSLTDIRTNPEAYWVYHKNLTQRDWRKKEGSETAADLTVQPT